MASWYTPLRRDRPVVLGPARSQHLTRNLVNRGIERPTRKQIPRRIRSCVAGHDRYPRRAGAVRRDHPLQVAGPHAERARRRRFSATRWGGSVSGMAAANSGANLHHGLHFVNTKNFCHPASPGGSRCCAGGVTAMSDETRRVLEVFRRRGHQPEAAIDGKQPFALIMELDAELAGGRERCSAWSTDCALAACRDRRARRCLRRRAEPAGPAAADRVAHSSTTETLCRLGPADALSASPSTVSSRARWWATKTRIGGGKDPDLDKIRALAPRPVIANDRRRHPAAKQYRRALRGGGILCGLRSLSRGGGSRRIMRSAPAGRG